MLFEAAGNESVTIYYQRPFPVNAGLNIPASGKIRSTSEFWWGAATKRQGESSVQVRRCPATVMRRSLSESEYPLAGFVN